MKLSKITISKAIIGLEVHIELKTKSKMFCSCSAQYFGQPANSLTCPVCLGMPGALPVPNYQAIEWTVILGMALNCRIPKISKFDRKNYFYPDLPKGYQISQYDLPLAVGGKIKIGKKIIRIRRVHLEEDTGKLLHQEIEEKKWTLIDFNRAGVPLVEIVTEPDFENSNEVKEYLKSLQQIVRWLGIADADMEKGQMRCEPTVNLELKNEKGEIFYTPLVELKNINSFRFAQKAIDYEIKRQFEEFLKTKKTKSLGNKTTRGWDEEKGITILQREKEEASDYRYFPEPDIPPIVWQETKIANLKTMVSELPEIKKEKFIKEYGVSEYQAKILTSKKQLADYFEETIKLTKGKVSSKEIANLIINKKVDIQKTSPSVLVKNLINKKSASFLDKKTLEKVVEEVLKLNPKAVQDYKKGKQNAIQFLIGQVMAKTKGQANPEEVRKTVERYLDI